MMMGYTLTHLYVIIFIFFMIFGYYFTRIYDSRPHQTLRNSKKISYMDPKNFIPFSRRGGLKCDLIFDYNRAYIDVIKQARVTINDSTNILTDCESIKKRSFFGRIPRSIEERNFPIAYAKLVFKDYYFLEMELSAEYAPQNFYCFSIDYKSSSKFKERMHNLSSCFPNVLITSKEFAMDSGGANHNQAYVECLKLLLKYQWKYVILMQNHDVILKTNAELVKIFTWFNGTNDISTQDMRPYMYRIDKNQNFTLASLKLFQNPQAYPNISNSLLKLSFTKSLVEACVSRAMADFLINTLNLTTFMNRLQPRMPASSPEETMFSTINSADLLHAPGGFTNWCMDKRGIDVGSISRITIWSWGKPPPDCLSRHVRHGICIHGIEAVHNLQAYPHIMVNKMLPDFDFGAIACWHEFLFNKTYLNSTGKYKPNPNFYMYSIPHVRYNKLKWKNGNVDMENFNCRYNSTIPTMLPTSN